jgi:hypothetical protein
MSEVGLGCEKTLRFYTSRVRLGPRARAERVSERRSAVLLPGVGTNLPEGFSLRHVPISLEKAAASRWPSTPTRRECSSRRRNCCRVSSFTAAVEIYECLYLVACRLT